MSVQQVSELIQQVTAEAERVVPRTAPYRQFWSALAVLQPSALSVVYLDNQGASVSKAAEKVAMVAADMRRQISNSGVPAVDRLRGLLDQVQQAASALS